MNTKIVSLVFCTAFLFLSFTLSSFQQPTDVRDAKPNNPVTERCEPAEPACTESITCPNGEPLSCTGKRFCTSTATTVKCDGRTKVCNASPAPPVGND
ncbi:MAG: hypothetical protein ACI9Y7_003053 [Dokdonia sp.]|jgi:hypothetical protein